MFAGCWYHGVVIRRARTTSNGRSSVSIEDVASEAGVSIATVSRVINNPSLVAAETTERVQAAIRRLGYVPNPFAQGLITRASRVLGIALPDIHGEFYSELLRGADAEARRMDYHLLVSSEHLRNASDSPRRNLAFGLVDGLALMITEPNETLAREASSLSIPIVLMDDASCGPTTDCVLVDNTPGTAEAVTHLLDAVAGRRLYFVGGPKENFDTRRRAEVFRSRLASTGIAVRDEQVRFGEYSVEWGREWARTRGREGLTGCGVLAGNDEIALGVLQAVMDLGLNVPGDTRIVGFDDTRLASLVRPTLSTVRVPLAEVGAAAIRLLVSRIEDGNRPAEKIVLPTSLVVRQSSGGA